MVPICSAAQVFSRCSRQAYTGATAHGAAGRGSTRISPTHPAPMIPLVPGMTDNFNPSNNSRARPILPMLDCPGRKARKPRMRPDEKTGKGGSVADSTKYASGGVEKEGSAYFSVFQANLTRTAVELPP